MKKETQWLLSKMDHNVFFKGRGVKSQKSEVRIGTDFEHWIEETQPLILKDTQLHETIYRPRIPIDKACRKI